jgi:hypothetical protein
MTKPNSALQAGGDETPVAYHDKDQPNGIAWCPGYPDKLRDISPLFARAVLSAGAPAVPLLDSDSSSSHLAAPGSTAPSALTVGTPPWISVDERMPEAGTECLVHGPKHWLDCQPFIKIDCWDEQREAPVSWSSQTVSIGLGWNDSVFDEVTHWMPLPPPPVQCDGRAGVTGSAASSEAREATPASHGTDGHGKDCA